MIKNLTIASLGFSSGLPYILIFSTLGVWLADIGIDLTLIGFFAWIVLTYSLKFLWAPLVDNFSIPILNRFGNRKSWILFSQSLIVICLILLSLTNPLDSLNLFAFIAFLVAFSGSIQDIAIDAFRIEVAELNQQGNLAASYQLGYRAAILISSSFALIFASEYFEHIERPVEHLINVINTNKPKYFLIANTFNQPAIGHFDTYKHYLDSYNGKETSKLFNNTLKENGYKKINTKLWNQRPNYWKLN